MGTQLQTLTPGGATAYADELLQAQRYARYAQPQARPAGTVLLLNLPAAASRGTEPDPRDIVTAAVADGYRQFLKLEQGKDAAVATAVIHAASAHVSEYGISFKKSPFFKALASEVRLQRVKYLPTHWRNLRDKIRAYATSITTTITTTDTAVEAPAVAVVRVKNLGNKHRCLLKEGSEVLGWLLELGLTERNYSAATIHRKLAVMCEQHGVAEVPSDRWVRGWLSKSETQLLVHGRYGEGSRFGHKYRAYTPTQSALYAGDCWDIDGTRVNIVDHLVTAVDKDGKPERRRKFLYIVVVRDVMSGMPVGWEYCHEESEVAITNALAAAVRYAGYLPYELRYDRFPGHDTQGWRWLEDTLSRLGVVMSQTVKAEGKAHTERWFGTLQSVFMADSALYYGEGVKSTRRHAHRSKAYVNKMRQWALRNGFSFDDACRETDSLLARHNATPYSAYSRKYKHITQSPEQLHEDSSKPNTTGVDQPTLCYLFGLRKQLSVANYMVRTQVSGVDYCYGVDDCELIERYTGVKLTACFDWEDLEQAHLYDGERYLGTFDRITPAQQYGPNKDMRAVGQLKAIATKVETHREQKIADITAPRKATPDEDVELSPEIGALLAGRVKKQQAEAAETALLREQWGDEDEGGTIKPDVTRQY
jgi:hypothetical protein